MIQKLIQIELKAFYALEDVFRKLAVKNQAIRI